MYEPLQNSYGRWIESDWDVLHFDNCWFLAFLVAVWNVLICGKPKSRASHRKHLYDGSSPESGLVCCVWLSVALGGAMSISSSTGSALHAQRLIRIMSHFIRSMKRILDVEYLYTLCYKLMEPTNTAFSNASLRVMRCTLRFIPIRFIRIFV